MSSLNKTSIFVENQLPGFIRGNPEYALFVQFLQKYYEYLELPGNPVYELRRAEENYDVDLARKTLLRYFKDKILPSFPEETELSTEKIIKASRDFYSKKGTPDAFKFLFRILYNQEVDIFLPKTNILRASDGKWVIPQAIRISFRDQSIKLSGNVTVNTATANRVDYLGNISSTNVTVGSYVRIGQEKRQVTVINTSANTFNVDLKFANTADAIANGVIYRSGNNVYRLYPNENANFDYSLLEKKQAIGANSRTTCIIENAYKTYDVDSGEQVAELFVSNVNRSFEVGENIEIKYTDTNGAAQTFITKVISLVSNVLLEKDRYNNTLGGGKYFSGDPVVFYGGLDRNVDLAKKAVAVVDEVSDSGLDEVRLLKRGFYFRDEANGGLIQIQSTSGVGGNLIIASVYTDGGVSNSKSFAYATDAIVYKKDLTIDAVDYAFDNATSLVGLTINAGNTITKVNLNTATFAASSVNDYYKSFRFSIIAGTGSGQSSMITTYNGTTKIATLSPALSVAPGATSNVKLTANANTEFARAMTYDTFSLGKIKTLDIVEAGSSFSETPTFETISTFETDYSEDTGFQYIMSSDFYGYDPNSSPSPSIKLNSSNSQLSLANGFYTGTRLFIDTGDNAHYATVVDYVVTDPATTANVKTLFLDRKFENNINALNINRFNLFFDYRANVQNIGRIGGVEVVSGGSGYTSGQTVTFSGTGYSAQGTIVTSGGRVVDVNMTNHGEGYYGTTTATISGGGSGANLVVWSMSDGESISATVGDAGKIKTFKILNRGVGYANTPNVSLKVVDIFTTGAGNLENRILTGDTVWQGNSNIAAADVTFTAKVDDAYDIPGTSNSIIRLYDYNGTLGTKVLYANTSSGYGNVTFSNVAHSGSYSFKNIYSLSERTYPHFYGNGLARARAEFLNGLVKYQGYYLNTDGFPSSDQRLENKDYYHNYSYEIQSEKSIDDYRTTVYEVIHPAGTQLLGKYLMKDLINVKNDPTSNICSSNSVGGTITTSNNTNVLSGAGAAALAAAANVGDIIIINNTANTANTERQFVRTITSVSPTVRINSPVIRSGDGELIITYLSAVVNVVGNTLPVEDTVRVGDPIRLFTRANGTFTKTVSAISGTDITLNQNLGNLVPSQNVPYGIYPTLTNVPYRLIKLIG